MTVILSTPSGIPLPAGLTPYVLNCMMQIDAMAVESGEQIKREHPAPSELRQRAAEYEAKGLYWLAGTNADLADSLERDPRLAAIPGIIAANRVSNGNIVTFANEYRELLLRHLDGGQS